MPNLVITSDTNTVKIVYNGLHSDRTTQFINRSVINEVCHNTFVDGAYVRVWLKSGERINFNIDGSKGYLVDTIDAATPTDTADLATKLAALIVV